MPARTRSGVVASTSDAATSSSQQSSTLLQQAGIATSEQLVKTLRIPKLSPEVAAIGKVRIALAAWHDASFFVPKKAELLSRWALEHLSSSLRSRTATSASASSNGTAASPAKTAKGKAKASALDHARPELDFEAWQLVNAIIDHEAGVSSTTSEAAKRSWISSLANTQPILLLSSALANGVRDTLLATTSDPASAIPDDLLQAASSALSRLLPPATSRTAATNIEIVTDTLLSWLQLASLLQSSSFDQHIHLVLQSLVPSWTIALEYGSNAKRNHQHFSQHALPTFFSALHRASTARRGNDGIDGELYEIIKQIGASSIFTEDALRSVLQSASSAESDQKNPWIRARSTSGILAKISSLPEQHKQDPLADAILDALPSLADILFRKLIKSEALPTIASSRTPVGSAVSGSVRDSQHALVRKAMLSEFLCPMQRFFGTHLVDDRGSLDEFGRIGQLAKSRKELVECIHKNGLYIAGCDEHDEWQHLLRALADSVRDSRVGSRITVLPSNRFDALTYLWRLDNSVLEPHLVDELAVLAVLKRECTDSNGVAVATNAWPSALAFFRTIADFHAKARSVPALVTAVMAAVEQTAITATTTTEDNLDNMLRNGLFVSQIFLAEFGKLCRDSIMPVQVASTLDDAASRMREQLDRINSSSKGALNGSPVKKQRSNQNNSKVQQQTPSPSAQNLILATVFQMHLMARVTQSVTVVPALRADCLRAAQTLHNDVIVPAIDALVNSSVTASGSLCDLAAAALRIRQSLLLEKWRIDPSEPVKLDGSLPTQSLPCLEEAFDSRADSLLELLGSNRTQHGEGHGTQELRLQILQALLQRAERDLLIYDNPASRYCQLVGRADSVLASLLAEISTLSESTQKIAMWNGEVLKIKDSSCLVQAIWMTVLTRWAGLLEQLASDETLAKLARTLVLTAGATGTTQGEAEAYRALGRASALALKDASFLELTRWRHHILAALSSVLRSASKQPDSDAPSLSRARTLETAQLLSQVPSEWLPKSEKTELHSLLLTLRQQFQTDTDVDTEASARLQSLISKLEEDPHSSSLKSATRSKVSVFMSQLSAEQYEELLRELLVGCRRSLQGDDGDMDQESELGAGIDESVATLSRKKDEALAAMVSKLGPALCKAPEGTSRIGRRGLTQFLGLLAMSSGALRWRVRTALCSVEVIESVCSSKAMLLRGQDVGLILQVFESLMAPSLSDQPVFSGNLADVYASQNERDSFKTRIFTTMVGTLGSLVRLRHDLLLPLLPQLTAVVSRMCSLFRRVRQQSLAEASRLHHRQLRRELPPWLDPLLVEPLGAAVEARAFSRLLSGFTVKNVPLVSSNPGAGLSTAAQASKKAESLAKPLSKHATHILVTWFRTLTSPNSIVPPQVRTELDAGMTTLCGIIGYHQRDSAMVGLLDAPSKTLFKRLWKEYEAQRYKGQ